jgi:hypothetical protein
LGTARAELGKQTATKTAASHANRVTDGGSGERAWSLCNAMSENSAFLAKFFPIFIFVSFVFFCKNILVATLPLCASVPLW